MSSVAIERWAKLQWEITVRAPQYSGAQEYSGSPSVAVGALQYGGSPADKGEGEVTS